MDKRSNKTLFDKPSYLKPFKAHEIHDAHMIAKDIIAGKVDFEMEEYKLNKIIYGMLNSQEKTLFKVKFLQKMDRKLDKERKKMQNGAGGQRPASPDKKNQRQEDLLIGNGKDSVDVVDFSFD